VSAGRNREIGVGEYIDLETWSRRDLHALFMEYDRPHFSITAEVDVSRHYHASRAADGPSFVLGVLFAAQHAANSVEALRLRIREQGVYRHHRVGIGCTVARPDRTFGFGYFEWEPSFARFQSAGRAELDRARGDTTVIDPRRRNDAWIHSTFLPWIRFTSFANAHRRDLSNPKLAFGQRFQRDGTWLMPVAVEVHHALADGLDVADFLQRFQEVLDAPLAG
jgi:chloramphenicol O-acetyltransferase type A